MFRSRASRSGTALVSFLGGACATASCAARTPTEPVRAYEASADDNSGWSGIANPALRHAVESGRLAAITGVGAVGILGILFLAMRTERRTTKTTDFVNFVDAVINRSPAVVTRTGRVLASGKYQIAFSPTSAAGWFGIHAPTRNVYGRVYVDAARVTARSEWDIRSLRVEFDKQLLDAANAERNAVATAAGYRSALSDVATAAPTLHVSDMGPISHNPAGVPPDSDLGTSVQVSQPADAAEKVVIHIV